MRRCPAWAREDRFFRSPHLHATANAAAFRVSSSSETPLTAQSDASWFADEVQPHEPMLRAYLQRQFPALADVDDVVQESHLRLLRARRRNGVISSAKSYLFAIARNVVLGGFRRRRSRPDVSLAELPERAMPEPNGNVADLVSASQELELATEAIDSLPARCREIVVLRTLHGLPHREIALQLGLSEQTVRVQVARGMKKCAEFLRARGITGSQRSHGD
jgi:RNA polymerase sigma factor (sigma-70 family)